MIKLFFIPMIFAFTMAMGQTVNSESIIGKPIIIGNLIVAQNDFPYKMNLFDANAASTKLGNSWRLPTIDELDLLYKNKDRIGGFVSFSYWSSSEGGYHSNWARYFDDGFQTGSDPNNKLYVRAVKDNPSAISDIFITKDMMNAADSAFIIGNAIILGKLVVSENDFPIAINWDQAKKICPLLGKGWRLPTKDELNMVFQNRIKIGGFKFDGYWSSTEGSNGVALFQSLINGDQNYSLKSNLGYFRAVRSL